MSQRQTDDHARGFTLVELMVTMVVLAVAMAMVAGIMVTTSRTFTKDRSATNSTNIAAAGMNELTRVIRAGTEIRVSGGGRNTPVFETAENETMTLHAFIDADSLDPRPVKVRFSVNDRRELVETRYPAVAGSGPFWEFVPPEHPSVTSRVITRQITTAAAGEPALFSYYTADDPDAPLTVPSAGLDETTRRKIVIVRVRLKVQSDATGRSVPVVIENQVGIPNLGVDRVGAGA